MPHSGVEQGFCLCIKCIIFFFYFKFNLNFRRDLCLGHCQRGGEGSKPGFGKLSMETQPAIVQRGVPAAQPSSFRAKTQNLPTLASEAQQDQRPPPPGCFCPPADLRCDISDSSIISDVSSSPWAFSAPAHDGCKILQNSCILGWQHLLCPPKVTCRTSFLLRSDAILLLQPPITHIG